MNIFILLSFLFFAGCGEKPMPQHLEQTPVLELNEEAYIRIFTQPYSARGDNSFCAGVSLEGYLNSIYKEDKDFLACPRENLRPAWKITASSNYRSGIDCCVNPGSSWSSCSSTIKYAYYCDLVPGPYWHSLTDRFEASPESDFCKSAVNCKNPSNAELKSYIFANLNKDGICGPDPFFVDDIIVNCIPSDENAQIKCDVKVACRMVGKNP